MPSRRCSSAKRCVSQSTGSRISATGLRRSARRAVTTRASSSRNRPESRKPLPDNVEAIHHVWVYPAEAVDRYRTGEFKMRTPTIRTLEQFSAASNAPKALLASMRAQPVASAITSAHRQSGERLLPGDPGYDDLETADAPGPWKI